LIAQQNTPTNIAIPTGVAHESKILPAMEMFVDDVDGAIVTVPFGGGLDTQRECITK
jgi:hypothetical protein